MALSTIIDGAGVGGRVAARRRSSVQGETPGFTFATLASLPLCMAGDEVAIVPLSTRLPNFVVGGKVCRLGKLHACFGKSGLGKVMCLTLFVWGLSYLLQC